MDGTAVLGSTRVHGHAWPPVRWQADRRWPGAPVGEPHRLVRLHGGVRGWKPNQLTLAARAGAGCAGRGRTARLPRRSKPPPHLLTTLPAPAGVGSANRLLPRAARRASDAPSDQINSQDRTADLSRTRPANASERAAGRRTSSPAQPSLISFSPAMSRHYNNDIFENPYRAGDSQTRQKNSEHQKEQHWIA